MNLRLSLRPKCTCETKESKDGRHFLRCDLLWGENSLPKKRKRFGLFYPLKTK